MITDAMVEAAFKAVNDEAGSKLCCWTDNGSRICWTVVKGSCLCRDVARAAIEAADREAWQPIETAPHHKVVLIGEVGTKLIAEAYIPNPASGWRHVHACDPVCFKPTHWRLLPSPPVNDAPPAT